MPSFLPKQRVIGLVLGILAIAGCSEDVPPSSSSINERPQVYVVNYPLQYFVQRIAGDLVEHHLPAPADEDPAFWRPTSDELAAYQAADLILLNGATYAKWVETVSLPGSRTVDTSAGFSDQLIETNEGITHSHGPGGEHAHTGTAFTTWLDFQLASQQATAIYEALVELLPEHADRLNDNFTALAEDLQGLDVSLREVCQRIGNQPLVASHPVYQYSSRRYGLNLRSLHWEPDVVPNEPAWTDLQEILAEHPAKWMIWEGPAATESVERLDSLGVASVVFNPCGNRPDQALDWLEVVQQNIADLKRVGSDSPN